MKLTATYLSSALLLGSWAAAQTEPLFRSTLAQARPSASAAASWEPLAQGRTGQLETPRMSSAGGVTKLVFDLPAGITYTLVPTFGGLRMDVGGARVMPASALRLTENLTEYRAGTGQVVMGTPFPLSLSDGWRASEATVASGSRVLIVELGSQIRGGAVSGVSGRVLAAAPADARAQASLQAPVPATDGAATSEHASDLPPGDIVQRTPGAPAPAPAAITDTDTSRPSTLVGRVPGTLQAGASVSTPRVGKSPGVTRMVLDLPPGTTYRIVPNTLGLRVELVGVSLGDARTSEQDTSSEVRAWRYERTGEGVNLTIVTGAPTTSRSGWRSQVLPPNGNNLTRLVLDISPAMANLTPLANKDRLIGTVPPMRAAAPSGLGLISSASSYTRPRVIIDPGHGGKDPGAMGTVIEKQVTLNVAKRVRDLLVGAGVDAVLTREADRELNPDKNTDLLMRAQMGTPGTQMFISIHVNATEASTALKGYGVETWWNPNHARSFDLASTLQRDLVKTTGAFDRGIKGYRSLSVLRNSRIPAALVEIGFTTHPIDGLNLTDNNYLERVAVGIAAGVCDALLSGVSASGQPAATATAP